MFLSIRKSGPPGVIHAPPEQDEAPLKKASQPGDLVAFVLRVRRHQRSIFHLSLGLPQDEEEASASAQEMFVAACRELPGFQGKVGFPTWLYCITYRCCLR